MSRWLLCNRKFWNKWKNRKEAVVIAEMLAAIIINIVISWKQLIWHEKSKKQKEETMAFAFCIGHYIYWSPPLALDTQTTLVKSVVNGVHGAFIYLDPMFYMI